VRMATQSAHGPWVALAAAVLIQALRDAENGSRAALRWLEEDPWAEALCEMAFHGSGGIARLRSEARLLYEGKKRLRSRSAAAVQEAVR